MINNVMTRREWGTLTVLAVIWGAAFLCISIAVRGVEPLTYVWLRLTIAAAGLYLFLRFRGKRLSLPWRVWGSLLILALLNNVIPFVLFGWGQQQIAGGLAAILNATSPIWAVLLAHRFTDDEKMTAPRLAGVLLGVAGVAAMMGPDLLFSGADLLPQFACLVGAFCYSLASVWARGFRAQGISPLKVATGQLIAGAAVVAPFALAIDQPWVDPFPAIDVWAAIVVLALVCTSFAYVLYFRLIETAGATNALLVTLLIPPVAIFLGGIVLGETFASRHLVGLGLIAVGLAAIDGRLFARRPA